ncbi:hypothetical protein KP509_03G016400 [Ceratopteris richardii]|uniref:Nodulin-like domain-containing protein n=1 Tax=Ceratopteris richardii TaxID=49495 RepID=A0A8T2V1D9_CERRI|nr:hypothetical protein KP509_03G016400 [Ceratopteris richardii]
MFSLQMAMASIGTGACISWMNTVVFNASVRNFTRNRGPVSGLFKACMGLSGAVFSILCSTLFSNSPAAYLLMLVVVPNVFCLISAALFKPVPTASTQEEEELERSSLVIFNSIASMLALYIASLDFLPSAIADNSAYQWLSVSVLLGLITAPVVVPPLLLLKKLEMERRLLWKLWTPEEIHTPEADEVKLPVSEVMKGETMETSETPVPNTVSVNWNNLEVPLLTPLPESHHTLSRRGMGNIVSEVIMLQKRLMSLLFCIRNSSACTLPFSPKAGVLAAVELGTDTPTVSLLWKWHYYVLYFSLFCGCGVGVTFNNNLGQVGESLGFTSVSIFVSLFSLGNFFGRIISGNISEHFIRVAGVPRPAWMGVVKVPMIVLLLWLSTGSVPSLYVGSLILGFTHGCLVTLVIPIVSEFYGLEHFSTNFVLTVTYQVAGSYFFSTMAGYLYDRQAMSQGDLTCYGSECYGTTFKILALLLTIALALDFLLTLISRPLYSKLRDTNNSR